jgi:hypothetical protein
LPVVRLKVYGPGLKNQAPIRSLPAMHLLSWSGLQEPNDEISPPPSG